MIPTTYLLTLYPKSGQERYIMIRCTAIPCKYLLTMSPKYTQERHVKLDAAIKVPTLMASYTGTYTT